MYGKREFAALRKRQANKLSVDCCRSWHLSSWQDQWDHVELVKFVVLPLFIYTYSTRKIFFCPNTFPRIICSPKREIGSEASAGTLLRETGAGSWFHFVSKSNLEWVFMSRERIFMHNPKAKHACIICTYLKKYAFIFLKNHKICNIIFQVWNLHSNLSPSHHKNIIISENSDYEHR